VKRKQLTCRWDYIYRMLNRQSMKHLLLKAITQTEKLITELDRLTKELK
jgi:hypothetical protein